MTTPRRPPQPQARLGGLIVASIAAHWLVLAGWEAAVAPPIAATALRVELLPAPVTEAQPPAREATRSTPGQPPQRSATPAATASATAATTMAMTAATPPPQQSVATAEASPLAAWAETGVEPRIELHTEQGKARAPQNQPKPSSFADTEQRIRTTLNHNLSRHFKYPHLARQRSWEGTVLLDLQIETDGRISRITLAQSSGYTLLDNNAIATLNRIGNVSGTEQWLEGENIELQLPVIYRLSDS